MRGIRPMKITNVIGSIDVYCVSNMIKRLEVLSGIMRTSSRLVRYAQRDIGSEHQPRTTKTIQCTDCHQIFQHHYRIHLENRLLSTKSMGPSPHPYIIHIYTQKIGSLSQPPLIRRDRRRKRSYVKDPPPLLSLPTLIQASQSPYANSPCHLYALETPSFVQLEPTKKKK
ncbi:hypothetical protein M501DRAFT_531671 [Patellaria atrata CBS 101060]|uniref:Uncharacterized protein n=1 Tax=Patellaria atrata CBS 101060 TaxID=1346257 RepID=A0A9P4SEI3_9PEZI|nr:hypothetical protein M501DRAFT_531671 [Patellaria atrata CBS 101060]